VISPYIRLEDNLFHCVISQVFFSRSSSSFFICFFSSIYMLVCGFHTFGVKIVKKNTMCFTLLLHFVVRQLERKESITKKIGSQHDAYARSATCFIQNTKKKRKRKKVAVGTHIYIYKRVPMHKE
jgi:diphthamide synthase subunit DPH2